MARLKYHHHSFTLIELIVSVSIIALILPTVFNIFFTMMRQQIVLNSYQDMKRQGDSVFDNVKNILQNRAVQITDNTYTTNICPILTSPTPTLAPQMYVLDRDGNGIKLSQEQVSPNRIASLSATTNKTYYLTSKDVIVSDLGFTCYQSSGLGTSFVTVSYTVSKSALFRNISLPYTLRIKLQNF